MTQRLAGALLIFAAVTFWFGWWLMPDAGTNDAAHILAVVRENRDSVWWSALVHIVSAVCFVPAVLGIEARRDCASGGSQIGAALVLVGAMGSCADAFFHLIAYYMTADTVNVTAMAVPMQLLQTNGIRFLVPLLLALPVGGLVYARALRKDGATSAWPARLFVAALLSAVGGGLLVRFVAADRHAVVLIALGLISAGYALLGFERMTRECR